MSGRSPRPDFGRTDYRFKINDNFGMLHETTLPHTITIVDIRKEEDYNRNTIPHAVNIPVGKFTA